MNNICDCSVNYGKECLYPENYITIGCNAESLNIIDYYEDAEYKRQMNTLEDMLLGGDVD